MTIQKIQRVYIETSVWNFFFVDDAPLFKEHTQKFFEQVKQKRFDVFISNLVLEEIEAAPEPRHSQLRELIDQIAPEVLQNSQEVTLLSQSFIDNGTIPHKYRNDAIHIAIAMVENMDILLSWNFKHIVKMKTKRTITSTSSLTGYKEIQIYTPGEVIDDVE